MSQHRLEKVETSGLMCDQRASARATVLSSLEDSRRKKHQAELEASEMEMTSFYFGNDQDGQDQGWVHQTDGAGEMELRDGDSISGRMLNWKQEAKDWWDLWMRWKGPSSQLEWVNRMQRIGGWDGGRWLPVALPEGTGWKVKRKTTLWRCRGRNITFV